jgi:hypothetical protein
LPARKIRPTWANTFGADAASFGPGSALRGSLADLKSSPALL